MTMETQRLGTGGDNLDFAAVDWRQHWKLCGCGLETTMETQRQGTGDDIPDLAALD